VATTVKPDDKLIFDMVSDMGIRAFRGSEEDVLDRFYQAVKDEGSDYIVRLTSDCPLIDAKLIDKVVRYTIENDLDYCTNTLLTKYPDGQDVEVFKFSALEAA
jgi:spore coat polysaccharide biosynthesis protein SpsF (cytidylyltransferase family)